MQCARCGQTPDALTEYRSLAEDEGITPDEYVRREEGTYAARTGLFWRTACYVALGCPPGLARRTDVDTPGGTLDTLEEGNCL